MKKAILLALLITGLPVFCKTINGEIKKDAEFNTNRIYDSSTNMPIEGVVIKIPAKHYITKTDKDGSFKLKTQITSPSIMALEKEGYKPFSMTLNEDLKSPIQIGIEKTSAKDIVVDTDMVHIGDDTYSERSANAGEFSIHSSGPFYSKDFNIPFVNQNENLYIILGSIIGIDTLEAQRMGQSNLLTAYSSPPEIFFNGNMISSIRINGDNQKIRVPKNLIKSNMKNPITIKTGRNLFKHSYVDFDDIEFTILLLEIK